MDVPTLSQQAADRIYGYDREEFTHTAWRCRSSRIPLTPVWAFTPYPICMEQYDLLIPDSAWETPMVQWLLDVLRSQEFRDHVNALGGYELKQPGCIRRRF